MLSIIRSRGVRLIAEIRARISATGSLREEGGFGETCEKGEGGAASGEDLLSETQKEERESSGDHLLALLQRPVNSPRAPTSPPSASSSSFFPFTSSFSCSSSSSSSFHLEAREARTTCLLEKSAPLPRALINLHSARSVEKKKGGRDRIPLQVPTRVTPINVADRMQSCSSY